MKTKLPYILIAIAFGIGVAYYQSPQVQAFLLGVDEGYEAARNGDSESGPSNKQSSTSSASQNHFKDTYKTLLVYPKKNPLPAFELVDDRSNPFTNQQFLSKWSILFTGYANCPDVCPNTLNQMNQLYSLLPDSAKNEIQFIFFSVDPERDTPEFLHQYIDYFNSDFIGITGDKRNIDLLIKALGGIYSLNKNEGEFYTVDHSSRLFLVSPSAERFGIIKSGEINQADKSTLARELTSLL